MAVAHVTTTTFSGGGTISSTTFNVTVAAGTQNPAVVVCVYFTDIGSTVQSATVGGSPSSRVVRSGTGATGESTDNTYSTEQWLITGVAADAVHEVIVTLDSSAEMWATATVLEGENGAISARDFDSGQFDTQATSGVISGISATSDTGDFVLEALAGNSTMNFTPASGQTEIATNTSSDEKVIASQAGASPSVSCDWTCSSTAGAIAGITAVSYQEDSGSASVELNALVGEFSIEGSQASIAALASPGTATVSVEGAQAAVHAIVHGSTGTLLIEGGQAVLEGLSELIDAGVGTLTLEGQQPGVQIVVQSSGGNFEISGQQAGVLAVTSPGGATVEIQGAQGSVDIIRALVNAGAGTIEIQGSQPLVIGPATEISAGFGTLEIIGAQGSIIATGYWAKVSDAGSVSWSVQAGTSTDWEKTAGHSVTWTRH